MTIQKFQAPTMHEALDKVKQSLGLEALILHTRSFRSGGVLGIGTREVIEVTAADEKEVLPRTPHRRASGPVRAYQQAALTASARRPAVHPLLQAARRSAAQPISKPHITLQAAAPVQAIPQAQTTTAIDGSAALAIKDELCSLRTMVHDVARLAAKDLSRNLPDVLAGALKRLLANDVSDALSWEIISTIRATLPDLENVDQRRVNAHLYAEVAGRFKTSGPMQIVRGKTNVAVFIGPTGVGKTTTIAKLATGFILRGGMSVALITNDTYRIAAVDQLRKYADIFSRGVRHVPLSVVQTPGEMARSLALHQGCDLVLVDTAGRSQRDAGKMDDLGEFIKATGPSQKFLVIDSTTHRRKALEVVKRFACAKPDKVILSKIDEAASLGMMLDLSAASPTPIAYLTTGQEVPDDIEVARSDILAKLVLEREVSDE